MYTHLVDLVQIKSIIKIGYVVLIEETGLSSKGKSIFRGRNIQLIITKLCIQVGLIRIQNLGEI